MTLFKGSGVALVTPFKDNQVDYKKLDELIEWHIQNHTDAIIICGTTGEASTMTTEEKKEVIRHTVSQVAKRIPVIAGTGGNNTSEAVEMSQYAERVGVDGLLLVTPYYNKTTQKGLVIHYTTIADAVGIPIILYNVPGRTGLNIQPQTAFTLSKHPNIVAIKEASGDISQVAEVARLCGEDFDIYSGNDDQIVPVLSLGGAGVISVVANILPKETHDIVELFLKGDVKASRQLQLEMNGLINSLFIETNPIPVKTAMNLLGMEVGTLRLPLVDMEDKNQAILKEKLEGYGLTVKGE
jgi:4-hydroxy-tetrahydrodipicolinate synthase